ncbi:hypothetical protein HDV57DRAFT_189413 [Trichoderma longibrachiatum]
MRLSPFLQVPVFILVAMQPNDQHLEGGSGILSDCSDIGVVMLHLLCPVVSTASWPLIGPRPITPYIKQLVG